MERHQGGLTIAASGRERCGSATSGQFLHCLVISDTHVIKMSEKLLPHGKSCLLCGAGSLSLPPTEGPPLDLRPPQPLVNRKLVPRLTYDGDCDDDHAQGDAHDDEGPVPTDLAAF